MIKLVNANNKEEYLLFDPTNLTVHDLEGNMFYLGFDISDTSISDTWFNFFVDVFSKIKEMQYIAPFIHEKLLEEEERNGFLT